MKAYKSGLTPYLKGDEMVYASRITALHPYVLPSLGECVKLVLAAGKEANLIPKWKKDNKPKVGGYFVVVDDGDPYYVSEEDFAVQFRAP